MSRIEQAVLAARQQIAMLGDRSDALRIRVSEPRAAIPILFVPTVEELAWVYWPLWQDFSIEHQVAIYRPDLAALRDLGGRVAELEHAARTLAWERFALVAWSDAAAVAYPYAARHPAKVAALVTIGYPGRYRVFPGFRAVAHLASRNRFPPLPFREAVTRATVAAFLGDSMIRSRFIRANAAVSEPYYTLFRGSIAPMMLADHAQTIDRSEIATRTTAILGDADRTYRARPAMAWHAGRGMSSHTITGGGHFMPFTHTGRVVELIGSALVQRSGG